VETDDLITPVRILGVEANANLMRAILTAAASGAVAAAKLITGK
jgi:hypothetical protein